MCREEGPSGVSAVRADPAEQGRRPGRVGAELVDILLVIYWDHTMRTIQETVEWLLEGGTDKAENTRANFNGWTRILNTTAL